MQTTRFKVWLKSGMQPVWPGIKFVRPPEYITDDAVDVTVEVTGGISGASFTTTGICLPVKASNVEWPNSCYLIRF